MSSKENLKKFNEWKRKHLKEFKKQCKKCKDNHYLCNHCYNSEVTLINKMIDEFGVEDTINKLKYDVI